MIDPYIQGLIDQGENQHLDFKFEVSDAPKLARTFSAFANTEGGRLLIGVKDNGVIAGIRTEEEAYMIESSAHVFCTPKVEYTLKTWKIEGKVILEVIIPESQNKPHLAPWKEHIRKAFIRMEDENFVVNSVQVEIWKNKSSSQATLVEYKHEEEELLKYLNTHQEISMNGFCKLSKIKFPLAKKILVNLCTIGVVEIYYTEHSVNYRLNQNI